MSEDVGHLGGLGHRSGDVWMTPNGPVRQNFGSLGTEAAALQLLISNLVQALDPEMIWLFGSRARGDARQDSDFDLFVVARPDGGFTADDYETVAQPIYSTGIDAEVVPCAYEDFYEALSLSTSFVSRVIGEGRLVFGTMHR